MAKVRVVHHSKGYRALLVDPKVVADVRRRAERVADAAGEGYVAESSEPRKRARAAVVTATGKAIRDNAENQTLLRSLDAAR